MSVEVEVDPEAIRSAWRAGAEEAATYLRSSLSHASGRWTEMADLTDCLASASDLLTGVTTTGLTLLTEIHENVEACLESWDATEHSIIADFNALELP
jgi:hypothetical protein